ncbi:MAG: hypothetical protein IPM01_01090 [Burkholderiaceae bacterium]|nr:hypothetical protein [Burkholderiaceae bacterium]
MLALKLSLVPLFLMLVTLAGRRYGPGVAGWLAGLPVVAGPILYFIALENGPAFASAAAASSTSAVLASVSFSVAYAHVAQRRDWPVALFLAVVVWVCAAVLLHRLPADPLVCLGIALASLLAAPRLFPAPVPLAAAIRAGSGELALRMAAGALMTLFVTYLASPLGSRWSGLLAVFPTLGSVLAVFSQRTQGAAYAATLLRAMATGLYSFAAFGITLSLALGSFGVPASFAMAVASCVIVQLATRRRLGGVRPAPAAVPR